MLIIYEQGAVSPLFFYNVLTLYAGFLPPSFLKAEGLPPHVGSYYCGFIDNVDCTSIYSFP